MSDPEIEIVRCFVVSETEKAYRLRDADNLDNEDYFPKSQVSFQMRNVKTGKATAEIPLWLLEAKGWNK